MLNKDVESRLGSKGVEEVLKNPWMVDLDHEKILAKTIQAPTVPSRNKDTPFDVSNFDPAFTNERSILSNPSEFHALLIHKHKDLFKDFFDVN